MGFYDFRCMVTGVSLGASDAVAVVLEPDGGGFRPISPGVRGTYNRLGSIDGITEDDVTEALVVRFAAWSRAGRLVLDERYGDPPADIEDLLTYLERNGSDASDERPALAVDGRRLFAALIAAPVWDALASNAPTLDALASNASAPDAPFGGSPLAREIFPDRASLDGPLRELAAVDAFVTARGLRWRPEDEDEIGAQHDADDRAHYLDAARRAFADVPALRAAFDALD